MGHDTIQILNELSGLWSRSSDVDATAFLQERGVDPQSTLASDLQRDLILEVIRVDLTQRVQSQGRLATPTVEQYLQQFPLLDSAQGRLALQDLHRSQVVKATSSTVEISETLLHDSTRAGSGDTSFEQTLISAIHRDSDSPEKGSTEWGAEGEGAFPPTCSDTLQQPGSSPGGPPEEVAGAVIAGRYRLVKPVGEGGMGTVWEAEQQQPIRRTVALKLVKAGMDSKQVLARFDAERQALARMDHPSIARVFDGGMTEQGRPFFVMEFVNGLPLAEYCDQQRLSLSERVKLFILICQAVQHAHQKGVIHRDLKPSNILVAQQDGVAVPKVIDFGLAKAMDASLTDQSINTSAGGMVGTPLYMSPEQAEFGNPDIDTRTDIYSLGVILYELLAGTTPIERKRMQKAPLDEVLRLIREYEPPRPSLRLTLLDTAVSIANLRQIELNRLRRTLCGDLDWVVMKALEKDRARRYETAAALSRDLERYLHGEPVEACPPSAIYRFKKFVGKHRGKVLAVASILVALVAGAIGTTVGFVRANRARSAAEESEIRALASERQALDALDLARSERDEKERQRKIAEQAEKEILESYRESTDDVIADLIGSKTDLGPQERAYLDKALLRWEQFANRQGDDARSQWYRSEGLFQVGLLWRKLGRIEDSRAQLAEAVRLRKALWNATPQDSGLRFDLARAYIGLGVVLHEDGNKPDAQENYQQACRLLETLTRESPGNAAYQLELARSSGNLGILLDDLGDWQAARTRTEAARQALSELVQRYPQTALYRTKLAKLSNRQGDRLIQQGEILQAKKQYEAARDAGQSLVTEFPTVAEYALDLSASHYGLGESLQLLKLFQESNIEYEIARGILRKLAGEYPSVPAYYRGFARSTYAIGNLRRLMADQDLAERELAQAIEMQSSLVERFPAAPDFVSDLGDSFVAQAEMFRNRSDLRAATASYQQAWERYLQLADNYPHERRYRFKLGATHLAMGELQALQNAPVNARNDYDSARTLFLELVNRFPQSTSHRTQLVRTLLQISDLERQEGHGPAALRSGAEAWTIQTELASLHPDSREIQNLLGEVALRLGRLESTGEESSSALAALDRSIQSLQAILEKAPELSDSQATLMRLHRVRAEFITRQGRPAEALPDCDRCLELAISDESRWEGRVLRARTRLLAGQPQSALEDVSVLEQQREIAQTASFARYQQLADVAELYSSAANLLPDQRDALITQGLESLKDSFLEHPAKEDWIREVHTSPRFKQLQNAPQFAEWLRSLAVPAP